MSYVESVEFHLHEDFGDELVTEPPYCVTREGWGGFVMTIDIKFNDRSILMEPRRITHDLNFNREFYEMRYELRFRNMSDESFHQLPEPKGIWIPRVRTGTKEKRDSWREDHAHETPTPKRKATSDPYASDDGGNQIKKRKTTASKSLGSGRRMSNRVTDVYDDDAPTS
ncbi:hypothetical protein HK097_007382, partial [Rhizophlyctis rosea]